MQELVLALGVEPYMARERDRVLQKLTCIWLDYEESIIKLPDSLPARYRNPLAQGPVFT